MKILTRLQYLVFTIVILIILLLLYNNKLTDNPERLKVISLPQNIQQASKNEIFTTVDQEISLPVNKEIFLAVVACGDRVSETLTLLKSALIFTTSPLHFLIVTENNLRDSFYEKLKEWQNVTNGAFKFQIKPLTFPKGMEDEWKKLFKPCASQRLFLPSVLPDIDAVIYVDTDTVFLAPVDYVWDHFYKMNNSQLAALAPEHEDANGWYNRFARHPYYGKYGVNSGVMLMNLTRMRRFNWTKYVIPIYKKYKLNITWGDQDIINIIFHYYPDKLYVYPCRFNYRPDHCMYMSICKSAEKEGVVVLHGSRGFFHSSRQPIFRSIYRSFEEYEMGSDKYINFRLPLESYILAESDSTCGQIKNAFLMNVKKSIPADDDENDENKL